ncbi:hypothetical protein [Nocardioides sp. J54]|uniref:hypothetical protein n=1 Tax=Nocardioides sp. J54 TaxID=935866 RepID=UPI00048FEA51|nr:hypothetical protein [Nocardioides sp. J54]
MYFDTKPCQVCGSQVELRAGGPERADLSEPVGPADGVVGDGDSTPDERVCTNADCPTNQAGSSDQP